jgi:hypothetical protein
MPFLKKPEVTSRPDIARNFTGRSKLARIPAISGSNISASARKKNARSWVDVVDCR